MTSGRTIFNLAKKHNLVFLLNYTKQKRSFYQFQKEKYTFPSAISLHKLYFSNEISYKCWNCNFPFKSQLFCSQCKVLQEPPDSLTYFDIIGVSRSYDVSVDEIRKRYKDLQKQLHPDKFGNKSEKEKEISEYFSTLVNKAYSTLTNPLKRGLYLLKLEGITIPEGTTSMNPEFLMEIMEKNEEIEEAEGDTGKILRLVDKNRDTMDTLSKELANAFIEKDIDKAKRIIIKLKYYDSIDSRLKKLKHDLGIVE